MKPKTTQRAVLFDLDGTLCTNTEGDYISASPLEHNIRIVNHLYNEGHYIYIQTARGFTTGIDWRKTTEMQLHSWKVKYHHLFFNKVTADIYIDDKAMNVQDLHIYKNNPLEYLG